MSGKLSLHLLIVPIALLFLLSCSGERATVVLGEEPLDRIFKVENNVDVLGVWSQQKLRADVLIHIDPSEDMTIFPESHAESMRNAAAHLKRGNTAVLKNIRPVVERGGVVNIGYMAGFFKRVIWVVPTESSRPAVALEDIVKFLNERRGYHLAALNDLKQVGGRVEGRIAGIPVTITSLDSLVAPDGPAVVDMDLSYFVAEKAINPGYQTGTAATLEFARRLASKKIRASLLTINLSNQNKICPMDIRFFGNLLSEAFGDPGLLQGEPPQKWRLMMEAERHLVDKEYRKAETLYEELVSRYPKEAGPHFALAVTRGFMGKGVASREELLEAMSLDSGYFSGFFQLARVLAAQDKIKTGEEILDTPYLKKIMADVELKYQKGIFYMIGKRPFDALTYLTKVAVARPDDFSLQSILYKLYRDVGNDRMAVLTLEKMRKIDNSRVIREMPWVYKVLGELYEKTYVYGNAVDMYELFLKIAPDDTSASRIRGRLERLKKKMSGSSR